MTEQIERQLDLPVSPEAAWPYVIEPDGLAQWLAEEVVLDPRPGGDAAFRVGEDRRSGWVEEVIAPAADQDGRLVFWWGVEQEPASRVTVTVTATDGGGSRLRVTETRPWSVLDLYGSPAGTDGVQRGPSMIAACA